MNDIAPLFWKEMREFTRDRRVFFSAIIMPMALVIVMMIFMGAVHTFFDRPERTAIAVVSKENGARLLQTKAVRDAFQVVEAPNKDTGVAMVRDKEVKLLVLFPEDLNEALESGRPLTVDVYLDTKSLPASMALSALTKAADEVNEERRDAVLASKHLTLNDIHPISLNAISTSPKAEAGSPIIETLLPYLLVLFSFFGAMSQAGDAVAGEKERGTLETLLVSPAGRVQIALAKLLSMAVICLAASVSGMIGVALSGVLDFGQVDVLFEGGTGLSPMGVVAIIGAMIPLVLMFAGMLVAVSAYARNQREANTYASAISFFVLVPAIASQFVGLTDLGSETWLGFVPVLNTAVIVQQGLAGEVDWGMFGITAVVSCVLAALALTAVVRMFHREGVLFRI